MKKETAAQLIARASKAVCGATERELTVPRHRLQPAIKKLESKGMYVIGTSYGMTPNKKIWFIRRGGI